MPTTRVFGDTAQRAICRDLACRARITFAQNVKTGKAMPFDGDLVALATELEPETRRPIWTVDLATSHFATCPAAKKFRH